MSKENLHPSQGDTLAMVKGQDKKSSEILNNYFASGFTNEDGEDLLKQ